MTEAVILHSMTSLPSIYLPGRAGNRLPDYIWEECWPHSVLPGDSDCCTGHHYNSVCGPLYIILHFHCISAIPTVTFKLFYLFDLWASILGSHSLPFRCHSFILIHSSHFGGWFSVDTSYVLLVNSTSGWHFCPFSTFGRCYSDTEWSVWAASWRPPLLLFILGEFIHRCSDYRFMIHPTLFTIAVIPSLHFSGVNGGPEEAVPIPGSTGGVEGTLGGLDGPWEFKCLWRNYHSFLCRGGLLWYRSPWSNLSYGEPASPRLSGYLGATASQVEAWREGATFCHSS